MSLPTSVRIAGIKHEIDYSVPPDGCEPTTCGFINHRDQRIWIDGSMTELSQRKVLLHELIHGVSSNFSGDNTLSESQTIVLENGLFALFSDNPSLADQLFKETR
jgi:hypothetical protein